MFTQCRKCDKEIDNTEYRYELPGTANGYLCYDCSYDALEVLEKWLDKEAE